MNLNIDYNNIYQLTFTCWIGIFTYYFIKLIRENAFSENNNIKPLECTNRYIFNYDFDEEEDLVNNDFDEEDLVNNDFDEEKDLVNNDFDEEKDNIYILEK
jgi:hypothetical protein